MQMLHATATKIYSQRIMMVLASILLVSSSLFRLHPSNVDDSQGCDLKTTAIDVVHGRDLSSSVIVITGGNTGIGYESALALASAGARVILCVVRAAPSDMRAAQCALRHHSRCL
jgi:hypothetical protein